MWLNSTYIGQFRSRKIKAKEYGPYFLHLKSFFSSLLGMLKFIPSLPLHESVECNKQELWGHGMLAFTSWPSHLDILYPSSCPLTPLTFDFSDLSSVLHYTNLLSLLIKLSKHNIVIIYKNVVFLPFPSLFIYSPINPCLSFIIFSPSTSIQIAEKIPSEMCSVALGMKPLSFIQQTHSRVLLHGSFGHSSYFQNFLP